MTFDDDMIQIEFQGGTKRALMKANGIEWPGPEKLDFMGFTLVKVSHSQITDEQRAKMTHVMRGALYRVENPGGQ